MKGSNEYLMQILLPLWDNGGKRLPRRLYEQVQQELTERYNGLTAYTRAPAEGLWRPGTRIKRESVVVYEVMVPSLDKKWWKRYRRELEERFRQETVVVRAQRTKVI